MPIPGIGYLLPFRKIRFNFIYQFIYVDNFVSNYLDKDLNGSNLYFNTFMPIPGIGMNENRYEILKAYGLHDKIFIWRK